jgi:hypothetical protein
MNLSEQHGKEVETFSHPQGAEIRAAEGQKLLFVSEYHGTYDDQWIVVMDEAGNELQRHNVSQLACWQWKL